MEDRFIKLKSDFNNVITIRNTVKNVFDILQKRIDKLKFIYREIIKDNKTEMFIFGLDSLYFQSKLIDIEYDDMKRLFLAINNRMYCEYFKLYKLIVEYILKNVNDKKIVEIIKVNNFPVYKDLEPFKEYNFEIILDIHDNIINLLSSLNSYLTNKEMELKNYKQKKDIGLNIDNFITSFNFNNIVIKEKITLFITYIEFFNKLHTKYLKRFSNKIRLMYTHVSNDINFDESVELNNDKNKEFINEYKGNNMNSDPLNNSIHVDSQSSDSENSQFISVVKTPLSTISTSSDSSFISTTKKKGLKNMNLRPPFQALLISSTELNKPYSDEAIKTAFTEIDDCCNLLINEELIDKISELELQNDNNCNNMYDEVSSNNDDNNSLDLQTNRDDNIEIPLTVDNVTLFLKDETETVEMKTAKLNELVKNELKEKIREVIPNENMDIHMDMDILENEKANELKELTNLKIVSNSQNKKHKKKKK